MFDHIKLAKLKEQLPCQPGDIIYYNDNTQIITCKLRSIEFKKNTSVFNLSLMERVPNYNRTITVNLIDLGKKLFINKSDAEEALNVYNLIHNTCSKCRYYKHPNKCNFNCDIIIQPNFKRHFQCPKDKYLSDKTKKSFNM